MKSHVIPVAMAVLFGLAQIAAPVTTPAFGQTATPEAVLQTVAFSVENMTCALCPVTVKRAMEGVEGVRSVEIDFDARTATVIFDPSVTDAGAIGAASANAGYPAIAQG